MSRQIPRGKLKSNCVDLLKKQINAFCHGTYLHGYRQMVNKERSKTERILWCLVVFGSLSCALFMMTVAWDYNSSRPTITVIKSTHRGIWFYPFPAITICNINRISLRQTREMVQNLIIPDDFTEEYIINEMKLLLELLQPGIFGNDVAKNLSQLQDIMDNNELIITNVISRITPNCSSLISKCKWRGVRTSCADLFENSVTRDGYCCSFNYISSREKSIRKPKRVPTCGYQTGLTLWLNPEPDDYLGTLVGSYGTKIILHYSYDYPDYDAVSELMGMGYQVFLSIIPEEMHTSVKVKKIPLKIRKCIFRDEIKFVNSKRSNLTYTKYSYRNCMSECRATTINAKCQCIPYYYEQSGTRVCTLRDVECMKEFKYWFETTLPGINVYNMTVLSTSMKTHPLPCNCSPDCTLFLYPTESSHGILQDITHDRNFDKIQNTKSQNQTVVHIFFSDLVSIQYQQSVYFDWHNLFASFGGLMGLFSGFSIMCGFELIYFFIIRVITDTYRR